MSVPILLCDGFDVRRLMEKLNSDEESVTEDEDDEEEVVFSSEEEEEEEWCEENRFCFYFVKQFPYDDPQIKAKIDEADNEIYRCNKERIHIANSLKSKRVERLSLVASMERLVSSLEDKTLMDLEDQEVVTWKLKGLSERLREIKMEVELLDVQMGFVLSQRDKAVEKIKMLRLQRDKGNAAFFQSRVVMKKALELAGSGNVRELEELANSEVDKFMSRWNNDKAFRDDYEKRILPSLDERKLRRNARIIHPENDVDDTENGNVTVEKKATEFKSFSTEEESEDDIPVCEKVQEEEEEIDEETLKEKRREEQLEKARLAMGRKKKLHEKAAARAAIRVKKEAEKKLKELEKRAKKKKGVSNSSETVTETLEKEKSGKEKQVNGRSMFPRHNGFRYGVNRKGNESVPKAILKRRRAYRLWVWTVSSAALALPLALLVAFLYVRGEEEIR